MSHKLGTFDLSSRVSISVYVRDTALPDGFFFVIIEWGNGVHNSINKLITN